MDRAGSKSKVETMRDITSKEISLRIAKAVGFVVCSSSTLELIKNNLLPKGNLFDVARAAGFLAAKNTQHLIPHCHPVSIDGMVIEFETITPDEKSELFPANKKFGVLVIAEGKSIGRTGIEMETLTAVSVCGLTIYDLLKPLNDAELEISSIKLIEKKGGKTDKQKFFKEKQQAAVLVCSDSTFEGKRKDTSGLIIKELLSKYNTEVLDYKILPDEPEQIKQQVSEWVKQDIPFIFTTGGTGFGPRDNTVEAVKSIIEKEAAGISEAMHAHGQMRTPLAMMSRSVAGTIKQTLIVTLPGSSNGAKESLEAILPAVFHARNMLLGENHDPK
ncbi:MAG TPA: bifunctional molybdenum cofactor biosynthesis protein MoaC/MoaB [Chitinophagales bacterium]|nr:bifunctional molybdenum cofactor biosynthesis protein MoaC/MoaB [Chitinophagales bacterium]